MNLQDAYTDFILSREAMNVTERTLGFYKFTLSRIISFLSVQDVQTVACLRAYHFRVILKQLRDSGVSDSYLHQHARVSKTFLRFCRMEGYIEEEINFEMPKIASKHLRVLDIDEIRQILACCESPRDKLLITFFVDTGVRLSELCSLNWSDINVENGSVVVREGKGKKFRVIGVGIKTRRLLLKYKSLIGNEKSAPESPLFQTVHGKRFTPMGLRSVLIRLSEKSEVEFSAHVLRRSFAKLSVKAGMNLIYIQSLMGHSNIETTRNYVQKLDNSEVLNAQKIHGTVDNYF